MAPPTRTPAQLNAAVATRVPSFFVHGSELPALEDLSLPPSNTLRLLVCAVVTRRHQIEMSMIAQETASLHPPRIRYAPLSSLPAETNASIVVYSEEERLAMYMFKKEEEWCRVCVAVLEWMVEFDAGNVERSPASFLDAARKMLDGFDTSGNRPPQAGLSRIAWLYNLFNGSTT